MSTSSFALLVTKVSDEPNPIKGCDMVKCSLCKADCWRAPSGDKLLQVICWDCFFDMMAKIKV